MASEQALRAVKALRNADTLCMGVDPTRWPARYAWLADLIDEATGLPELILRCREAVAVLRDAPPSVDRICVLKGLEDALARAGVKA